MSVIKSIRSLRVIKIFFLKKNLNFLFKKKPNETEILFFGSVFIIEIKE